MAEGLGPSDLGGGLGAGGAGAVGAARAGRAAGAAALARRAADLRGTEGLAISWLVGRHEKSRRGRLRMNWHTRPGQLMILK